MSKLTGTHSEASEIDFTTLTTVPGTVKVHGAPIQILDLREILFRIFATQRLTRHCSTAGIIEGANDGRGRGRQGLCLVAASWLSILTLLPSSNCRYVFRAPRRKTPLIS
jgi:ribosome-interacting GTPase 1